MAKAKLRVATRVFDADGNDIGPPTCPNCGARLSMYRLPGETLCAPCTPEVPVRDLWPRGAVRQSIRR